MNAPDKIYVIEGEILECKTTPFNYVENIEYLRKDALLEWAKSVKADPMIPMNIDKIIEKIESL